MIVLLRLQGCRRAPNANGKLMPEWEDMAAVACAVQNLHFMATALGLAGKWHCLSPFCCCDARLHPVSGHDHTAAAR